VHAALARSPEPAPAGGRARCWPDHQLPAKRQLSGRARGAERLAAAQRRSKKKNGPGVGHGENQIRHGGRHQSVLRGNPLHPFGAPFSRNLTLIRPLFPPSPLLFPLYFVGNLAKRVNPPVSDHADHEVLSTALISLSEGLPPKPTSPSARRGRRPPVQKGLLTSHK
jgi:hypothetical protein